MDARLVLALSARRLLSLTSALEALESSSPLHPRESGGGPVRAPCPMWRVVISGYKLAVLLITLKIKNIYFIK
jgi:hypothetical protein